ncbi:MAG: hypothetical protein K6F33_07940 [Bacteroidales bacterium]|nr:hypothetical protein [Bacteroidales bacterium]
MIVTSKKLFYKWLKPFTGITLWPFIILRDTADQVGQQGYAVLLNHERIHLRQQAEMLVVFFYIMYFFYYVRNRLKGQTHFDAYRNIPFERESYEKEADLDYLKQRKFWQWRMFIK